jgi:hypothetical protein
MNILTKKTIQVACILIVMIAACTKDKAPAVSCQSCPVNVSFTKDIIPILATNCAIGNCHTGSASGALSISYDSAVAYTQATARGRYILPGNPNASLFYSQLLAGANNHMPFNGRQLDPCTIQKIYCWIEQGALDN